jgi:hypothetical protein
MVRPLVRDRESGDRRHVREVISRALAVKHPARGGLQLDLAWDSRHGIGLNPATGALHILRHNQEKI